MSVVTDQEHPNPFVEELAKEYRRIFHDVYCPLLSQLVDVTMEADKISDKDLSLEDAVDLGFLCREIHNKLDELRKEVKARQEKIGRLIALSLMNKVLSGSEEDVLIRGLYASGTPEVGVTPKIPSKGTQEYADLCKHFGINPELAQLGLVYWHYPKMVEYCTELAGEGKKMPPGIDGSATKITTTFRRRQHGKT